LLGFLGATVNRRVRTGAGKNLLFLYLFALQPPLRLSLERDATRIRLAQLSAGRPLGRCSCRTTGDAGMACYLLSPLRALRFFVLLNLPITAILTTQFNTHSRHKQMDG